MPRGARPWFRFYVEAMGDRKIRRLSHAERWLWVAILSAARESPAPGHLMVSDTLPMSDEELASYADVPVRIVRAALPKMVDLGMIAFDDSMSAWLVSHWSERQFESDETSLRTALSRSRERSKNVPTDVATTLVGTESSVSVSGSVSVEEEREQQFIEFFSVYPLKVGKIKAREAFAKALTRESFENILAGAVRFRDDPNRELAWTKHPTTWLNQGCWDDDPIPPRYSSNGHRPPEPQWRRTRARMTDRPEGRPDAELGS